MAGKVDEYMSKLGELHIRESAPGGISQQEEQQAVNELTDLFFSLSKEEQEDVKGKIRLTKGT